MTITAGDEPDGISATGGTGAMTTGEGTSGGAEGRGGTELCACGGGRLAVAEGDRRLR